VVVSHSSTGVSNAVGLSKNKDDDATTEVDFMTWWLSPVVV